MKKWKMSFLLLLLVVAANAQNNYAEAIQQGDAAFKMGEYKTAIL